MNFLFATSSAWRCWRSMWSRYSAVMRLLSTCLSEVLGASSSFFLRSCISRRNFAFWYSSSWRWLLNVTLAPTDAFSISLSSMACLSYLFCCLSCSRRSWSLCRRTLRSRSCVAERERTGRACPWSSCRSISSRLCCSCARRFSASRKSRSVISCGLGLGSTFRVFFSMASLDSAMRFLSSSSTLARTICNLRCLASCSAYSSEKRPDESTDWLIVREPS
mmetsp:Transcript_102652/g.285976  ORF Transcript_102652/g.285976 Transcript_102652/m.285976 type:complete len:220 (-) Transcript_102652:1112-1771(-)